MAGDKDGAYYSSVEGAYFGDGTTDATTEAMSVARENALDQNTRYLMNKGSGVVKRFPAYIDKSSGNNNVLDKPDVLTHPNSEGLTAARRAWWFFQPWPNFKPGGFKEIVYKLYAQPTVQDSTNHEPKVALVGGLRDFKGQLQTKEIQFIEPNDENLHVYVVTLDLTGVSVRSHPCELLFGWYGLGGSSEQIDTQDNETFSDWSFNVDTDTTTSFASKVGPRTTLFYDGKLHDIFYNNAYNETGFIPPMSINGKVKTDLHDIGALRPVALSVDVRKDETEPHAAYTPKPPEQMAHQKPVIGRHVSTHGDAADEIRTRPRCRALGPKIGKEDQGSTEPARTLWRWLLQQRNDTRMDLQMIQPAGTDPTISLYGYFSGWYYSSQKPSPGTQSAALPDWDQTVDVEITMKLYESMNTQNVLASNTTTVRKAAYHIVARTSGFWIPNIVFWALRNDSGNPDSYNSNPPQVKQVYREGSMMTGRQFADRFLLEPIDASLDLSGVDAGRWEQQHLPLEVELSSLTLLAGNANTSRTPETDGITIVHSTGYFEENTLH